MDQVLVRQAEMLFKNKQYVVFFFFVSVFSLISVFLKQEETFKMCFQISYIFRYDESAVHYAQTQSSFEEISLKFLQARQMHALKLFLRKVR